MIGRSVRSAIVVLGAAAPLLCGCGGELEPEPPDAAVPDGPRRLSTTGLYADPARRQIAPEVSSFAPRFALWSDGAVKQRWLYLPPGTQIDRSAPEHWILPVGARVWKQFAAPDGTLLETRLIERVADTGDDDVDYWLGAFAWLPDQSDAVFVGDGADDVLGTDHDVPTATQCRTCHTGERGNVLGLSAVQQGEYEVPGDPVTVAALGYLHANCGNCHNPEGSARPDVDMTLRLGLDATTPEDTTIWQATVGVPLARYRDDAYRLRVAPGDPEASGLLHRMSVRGPLVQMPPIASEVVDDAGVAIVRAWIAALPVE